MSQETCPDESNGPFAGGVRPFRKGGGPRTRPRVGVFSLIKSFNAEITEKSRGMEQGLIQVYTGEGKGKTTAAVGLAVRALGQGLWVLLVRFLKPAEQC